MRYFLVLSLSLAVALVFCYSCVCVLLTFLALQTISFYSVLPVVSILISVLKVL